MEHATQELRGSVTDLTDGTGFDTPHLLPIHPNDVTGLPVRVYDAIDEAEAVSNDKALPFT